MTTKVDVLKRIARHDGEWGWYQLERAIDPRTLAPDTTVMSLVRELETNGLVIELSAKPMPKYKLTEKGSKLLAKGS